MKPAMLAPRATPQGEEYFEFNREFPSSLPATKIFKVAFPTPQMSQT